MTLKWADLPDDFEVTEPCIIDGMPDAVYHGDPVKGGSLSHSGLKSLLDCPARFKDDLDTGGRPPKNEFDLGHAAHAEVLGEGQRIDLLDFRDYKSKAAQAARDASRAIGHVPLLTHEWLIVQGMAGRLREHPRVGGTFRRTRGTPERAMFWYDDEFGFWRRLKLDWTTRLASGRLAVVDYKSTANARPTAIEKHLYDFGYYTQESYYRDGVRELLGEDPVFLFVFQEKVRPYPITVAELDDDARTWGALKVREGLDLYARCRDTDTWPEYAEADGTRGEIVRAGLPKYATYQLEDQWRSGRLDIS